MGVKVVTYGKSNMQIDSFAKIIYVHIPRTGGRWFSHGWRSHTDFRGECHILGAELVNTQNKKTVACGRHGRLSGILEKLDVIGIDHTKYKKITIVREPVDRVLSSWIYFFKTLLFFIISLTIKTEIEFISYIGRNLYSLLAIVLFAIISPTLHPAKPYALEKVLEIIKFGNFSR